MAGTVNDDITTKGTSDARAAPVESRIAFERLRERTDELELIISGISLVALVSLPAWLFAKWIHLDAHADGMFGQMVAICIPMAIGLSYTLAGAFLVHLVARAYWVGLIGLKSVFPLGIRWERIDSVGPITREQLRERAGLEGPIDGADRFASVVFAVVSLITLSILVVGFVMFAMLLLADLIARSFGMSERATPVVLFAVLGVFFTFTLLPTVIDRATAALRPAGHPPAARTVRLVRALNVVQGFVFPQKLILPVQLALESNMPRRAFSIAFGLLVVATTFIGMTQTTTADRFALIGNYAYEGDADVRDGLRSAHYEDMRGIDDALLRVPMIPSDRVADPFLRVFLPYIPRRDNGVLQERCPLVEDSSSARRACLSGLWTLSLDGHALDATDFDFAERRDLGLRGLQGYVSIGHLAPGRHELVVTWNAGSKATRGERKSTRDLIPFWFAPPYQLDYTPPESTPPRLDVVPSAPAPAAEDGSEGKVD